METKEIIKYLQDIVKLETQKRITGNTYNRLLIIEKNNTYVHNASMETKTGSSSVKKDQMASITWKDLSWFMYSGGGWIFD